MEINGNYYCISPPPKRNSTLCFTESGGAHIAHINVNYISGVILQVTQPKFAAECALVRSDEVAAAFLQSIRRIYLMRPFSSSYFFYLYTYTAIACGTLLEFK